MRRMVVVPAILTGSGNAVKVDRVKPA
jgi:hypothetical protein